jgi:general secretion pathway protein B
MSFILDALKKSESDRQRQSGPALFEVKVAAPRTGLPLWAVAVAALLVVNLAILMWMLWRHPAARTADPSMADTSAAAPAPRPAPPLPASATQERPQAAAATPAPAPPPMSLPAPAASPPAAAPVLRPTAGGAAENPDDYAPAAEPAAAPLLGSRVRRDTVDGVPLYQDVAATPGARIPQLRLDLHVFAAHPQERFVMINMHKLREGDSLPEGVHVDSITPEGAVLSYSGSRFLLTRD